MHDLAAGGDLIDHVAQADVFLEAIFAGLQLAELAFENDPELHERRIGDDAFALELGDDLKQVAARRNIDDLVGRERPRFFQLVHGGDDAEDAGDKRDEHETQEAARHRKRSFAALTLFGRRRGFYLLSALLRGAPPEHAGDGGGGVGLFRRGLAGRFERGRFSLGCRCDGGGAGFAMSPDGGAGAFGGSGRGASAFAAIGGWLGGSGADATMAGPFTKAASDGETSVGGAPESFAGAFRVG